MQEKTQMGKDMAKFNTLKIDKKLNKTEKQRDHLNKWGWSHDQVKFKKVHTF